MATADDIFGAAPRGKTTFNVNGIDCTLVEMSVTDSIKWSEHFKRHKGDPEALYAFLISICCVEMRDIDQSEIIDRLSPNVLMKMGDKILEISGYSPEESKKKVK